MNLVRFFIFIFLVSCSNQSEKSRVNFREISSLKSNYTNSEFEMDTCLSSKNHGCSFSDLGCQKEGALSCSNSIQGFDLSTNELEDQIEQLENSSVKIAQYDWFFLNPFKINRVLNFIKKLNGAYSKIKKQAISYGHGQGVGISATALAVEGRSFLLEAILLNNHLGLYCAPGVLYGTDIGVELGVTKSMALGCKEVKDYTGEFVSVGAGISLTNFAIPIGIEIAYSFGLDSINFKKEIKNRKVKLAKLILELNRVEASLIKYFRDNKVIKPKRDSIISLLAIIGSITGDGINFSRLLSKDMDLKDFKNNNSLGLLAKKTIESTTFNKFLDHEKFYELKKTLLALGNSLSGCDSISSAISASLTASPISLKVASTHFSSLYQVDVNKVLSLKRISSFMLLNPILMDKYTLRKIIELAVVVESFPSLVENKCYSSSYENVVESFSLSKGLFSK